MGKSKLMSVRFEENLYDKIEEHALPNSKLIRTAVLHFLNGSLPTKNECEEDISDDIYGNVYTTLYNMEILPLKQNIKHYEDTINMLEKTVINLENDKNFLQQQLHAQTLLTASKIPLLSRIKTKFLRAHTI